jgi:hypothetical protein
MCVRLEGMAPWWWSSSCFSYLQRAVTFNVTHRWRQQRSSRVASFGFSPGLRCSVMLCVLLVCVAYVVVFASSRYVRLLLLLI